MISKIKKEKDVAVKANSSFRLEVENIQLEFREQTRELKKDYQIQLNGKDQAMDAVREEFDQEKIELLAKVETERQHVAQIESKLLLELDQLQKVHSLEFKSLQKKFQDENFALINKNAALKYEIEYLEKNKLASDEELRECHSRNRFAFIQSHYNAF